MGVSKVGTASIGTLGALTLANTTASSSTTTGAFICAGGAGIAGHTYLGGSLYTPQYTGNILVGGITSAGSASGCIGLGNAGGTPVGTPTNGGVLYAEAGVLKWKGSSGTVTTIAAA